jgi:8-oxo-dGTP pyrophosphatase MutT (NUDIX family)
MHKIYVQNKPLFLADQITPEVEDYLHRPDTIFIDELNGSGVRTMLQQLETPDVYAGVFVHPDLDALLDAFKSHLTLIVASGGLVHTKDAQVLLIFRKGKWDLPKGKLDADEELEACALREIEEETGAQNLKLERPLHITYHTYYENRKHILKESHWFLVSTETTSGLKPQTEEDIEKCEWVALDKLSTYFDNMHASIIDVIKIALKDVKAKVS